MTFPDLITFVKERTALAVLSEPILEQITSKFQEIQIPSEEVFIQENTEPTGLYILQSGYLESSSEIQNKTISLLPGAALNLYALLLNRSTQYTVKTINATKLWFIPASEFLDLIQNYPEIIQAFSQQLAEEVDKLSSQLNFEQEKQLILRPYLVNKAKRGVIGKSRYAVRLRSQIKQAAETRDSVLIFGEPGLEKDNLAALIHFGSNYRREPIIKVDCSKLQASGAELFGRVGGKPSLIEALGEGTLVFNNIQQLPKELLPSVLELIETNKYTLVNRPGENITEEKTCLARIIIISEQNIPTLNSVVKTLIKVPPLRVRKEDLDELVNYYINLISRNKCLTKPKTTPEALRKLQTYDFPNNLRELESIVERALIQLQGCTDITEEIVWQSQSKKKQYRLNLLNRYPALRNFLRSDWYPDRVNYGFTFSFFAFIVLILFIAPQNRQENFALNMFWACEQSQA